VRYRRLNQVEHAWILTLNVSSHSSSEMSSMDLKLARCAALLTRIIDAPEFFAGGLDDLATMGGGLDIAGQKHSLAPGLL
jgi:hypothetical protein